MAIEKLGESLLQNVRDRNDQIARDNRKRKRKQDLQDVFATVAIGIGNSYLADQTNKFLNQKDILDARATHKSAVDSFENISGYMKKVDESGKSHFQYTLDAYLPTFKENLKMHTSLMDEDTDAFNDYAIEKITPEIKKIVEAREKAFEAGKKLDADRFDGNLVSLINKAAPPNIGGLLARKATALFGGKTEDQIKQDVENTIINGPGLQNARDFEAFKKLYSESKDALSSYNFKNVLIPDAERDLIDAQKLVTSQDANGAPVLSIIKYKKDAKGNEFYSDSENKAYGITTKPLVGKGVATKTLKDAFNPMTSMGRNLVNEKGMTEFIKRARKDNLNYLNITQDTDENYTAVMKHFFDVATDPQYMNDPTKESVHQRIMVNLSSSIYEAMYYDTNYDRVNDPVGFAKAYVENLINIQDEINSISGLQTDAKGYGNN